MLITLKSTSDSEAHDFTNFFKENVMIEPNSEIALVNCAYNFQNGITVPAGLSYTLKLGSSQVGTVSLTSGTYTRDSFLTMLNSTLNTFLNSGEYRRQRAFPAASSEFVYTSSATDILKLELHYDPQAWETLLVHEAAPLDVRDQITTNVGMFKDNGVITKSGNTDDYTDSLFHAGDSATSLNCMWATAKDVQGASVPHGSYKFRIQQNDASSVFGLAEQQLPTNYETDMVVQISFDTAGTFDILEKNSLGSLQSILTAAIAYNAFDLFEIRVDQLPKNGGSNSIYARYFKNGTEITGTNYYALRPELKLIPLGSLETGVTEKVVKPASGLALSQCLDTTTVSITAAGSDYKQGELVTITQGSQTTTLEVNSVNISGGITSLKGVKHGGGLLASTSYNIVSSADGTGATLNSGTLVDSSTLSNAGTGYSDGNADLQIGAATYSNAVDLTTTGGVISSLDFLTDVEDVGLVPSDTINIVQAGGSNGEITVNAIDQDTNSVSQLSYDVVQLDDVDEPLTRHAEATFSPNADMQELTDLKFKTTDEATPLEVQAAVSVKDDRETDVMLINVDQFQIKSICKDGGIQKAVGALPYGLEQPVFESGDPVKVDGNFIYRPYNLIYQKLENQHTEMHNQLRVRLTDSVGRPLVQLKHPTTITLDLQPRAK